MANRYWVGGSGTWNTTSTTNWSDVSGGASGASVPTAADSVFFDQAGTYTVTMTGALTCLDITVSAGTVTFATGTSPTLAISGSMSLVAGTIWSSTGVLTFNSTSSGNTITTNGTTISAAITFNGSGGVWTLGSALTMTGQLTITNGTLDTSAANSYALTFTQLAAGATVSGQLNLNASTVTATANGSSNLFGSGLTLNAGTSQFNLSGTAPTLTTNTAGVTLYNVSFTFAPVSFLNTATITGSFTFNNLSFASPTGDAVRYVTISSGSVQTINGTLSASGSQANKRIFFASSTAGSSATINLANPTTLSNCDFRDIVAGTSTITATTSGGDCGGNTNITLSSPKTVYWNLSGAQQWSAIGWASTPTGTPDVSNFPLAQDTAVFTNSGSVTGAISLETQWNYGSVNMSTRTNAMTIAAGITQYILYGDWINGSGTTISGTGIFRFSGIGNTQQISGNFGGNRLQFNNIGGIMRLVGLVSSTSSSSFSLISGTLDLNGYTMSINLFATSGTATKNLTFNGGTLALAAGGTAIFNNFGPTGFTTTAGTGTGKISMTSAVAKTFIGGDATYNCTLNQGGAGALTVTGNNTFNDITNTVQPASILFTAGTTNTFNNFSLRGTAGNLITISSPTAATHTLNKSSGTVTSDYLSISYSNASGGAGWFAGANSVNGGNNTGWNFTAGPVYLTLSGLSVQGGITIS